MTTIRRFCCDDLLSFNKVNLDVFTETYHLGFYLTYLAKWPEYCLTAEGPNKNILGYIIGKAEGGGRNWHGHVTAVTVEPDYRRQGLAKKLMDLLEDVTEKVHFGYFVDLFVRVSNHMAIAMYTKFGYTVYRRVIGYYSGDEDAYDMRKAMKRDVLRESVIPLPHPVYPSDLENP
uniref:N-acetyltransferase domain-containing protein n=1 Tax=Tetraselmis chuii TaxID=63592 RepID=A0A6U1HGY3_9CHLO|mmetsp:Transcript_28118/g.50272  ORF Transcript_28118/g.50272 Transcript_28118/m.50272 type:complete len:175 (+) Transcript_28118:28-552(+)